MSSKNIIITGGGTGGHIYPGVAIADALKKQNHEVSISLVGAVGGLEEKIFPKTNYDHYFLPVGRFHSSIGRLRQLKTLALLPWTLLRALILTVRLKPDYVLGVGGFASAPMLIVAKILGVPYGVWEANAYPGLVNRKFARGAKHCFVVFEKALGFMNVKSGLAYGLPVRKEFFNLSRVEKSNKMRVLVFGGSQGARAINEAIADVFTSRVDLLDKIDLTHQTGHIQYDRIASMYSPGTKQLVKLLPYIDDMPAKINEADLVICRAGASTVAEVVSLRKPAIYIPLPTAADNHQLKNAEVVEERGGGIIVEQKDLTVDVLVDILNDLMKNTDKLVSMAKACEHFDDSAAGQKISLKILSHIHGDEL